MQIQMKVKDRTDKYFTKLTLFHLTARSTHPSCRRDWQSLRGGAEQNYEVRNVANIKKYSQISGIFDSYVLTPAPILRTRHVWLPEVFNSKTYLKPMMCMHQ